jgi:hypothetical protein
MGNKLEKRANLERRLHEQSLKDHESNRSLASAQSVQHATDLFVKHNSPIRLPDEFGTIDCACVIHDKLYGWEYVDKLYNMLSRHLTPKVRLHVYTEHHRSVPPHMIKHVLDEWPGISGPKKSWWYKIQMFNSEHHAGPMLYFDLDTVITGNIDWIWGLPPRFFYSIKDFRSIWKPTDVGINSSIMWWDTTQFNYVWSEFLGKDLTYITKQYHGDQDFLTEVIPNKDKRYLDPSKIKSWRWQALDGGFDFRTRKYRNPNTGTRIDDNTSVLVLHGDPKPADVDDPLIKHYWK